VCEILLLVELLRQQRRDLRNVPPESLVRLGVGPRKRGGSRLSVVERAVKTLPEKLRPAVPIDVVALALSASLRGEVPEDLESLARPAPAILEPPFMRDLPHAVQNPGREAIMVLAQQAQEERRARALQLQLARVGKEVRPLAPEKGKIESSVELACVLASPFLTMGLVAGHPLIKAGAAVSLGFCGFEVADVGAE